MEKWILIFAALFISTLISCQQTLGNGKLKLDTISSDFNAHKFYEKAIKEEARFTASADTIKSKNSFSGGYTKFGIQYNQKLYVIDEKVAEFYTLSFERLHMRVDNYSNLDGICAVGSNISEEKLQQAIEKIDSKFKRVEKKETYFNKKTNLFWESEYKKLHLFWKNQKEEVYIGEEEIENEEKNYKVYLYIIKKNIKSYIGNPKFEEDWKYYYE